MPVSVLEQIAQQVKARVESVTIDNGYDVAVKEVIRPTRLGRTVSVDDGVVVQVQGDPEPNAEDSFPGNPPAQAWDQPFILGLYVRPSESDVVPLDARLNEFRASVEKAVATPQETWHNWEGLAINSRWDAPQIFETDDDSITGVMLVLVVTYRTSENDPYLVR